MEMIFTVPSSCYRVPGMNQDQLGGEEKETGEFLYEVDSPLWGGGCPRVL